jgi:hypothetical protein
MNEYLIDLAALDDRRNDVPTAQATSRTENLRFPLLMLWTAPPPALTW